MAIAFDAAASSSINPGTTLTYNHTCTGSNLILFVCVISNSGATTSSVKYAGVSLTKLDTNTDAGGNNADLWYLINPSTGTNSITITMSGNVAIGASSASYTGVHQTTPINAHGFVLSSGNQTSLSKSLTSTTDACWMVAGMTNNFATTSWTGGTNTTVRAQQWAGMCDRNAATSPAGSETLNINCASSASLQLFAAMIAPVATATNNQALFLGSD